MNIFILDYDIEKCVKYYFDSHCVKMLLEYAQLLSTTNRLSGLEEGYKATHINHPCSIWTRESLSNWRWLRNLSFHLHDEWKFRFNHKNNDNHKSYEVIVNLSEPPIKENGLTKFVQVVPDKYKCNDAITAYRNYYIYEKPHLAKWTKREMPDWLKQTD